MTSLHFRSLWDVEPIQAQPLIERATLDEKTSVIMQSISDCLLHFRLQARC